jgi:hypothetical protein
MVLTSQTDTGERMTQVVEDETTPQKLMNQSRAAPRSFAVG